MRKAGFAGIVGGVALFSAVAFAKGAPLAGKAVDSDGKPVLAVVYLTAAEGGSALPNLAKAKGPKVQAGVTAQMKQKDKAFAPRIIAVEPGQAVRFVNEDAIFHNVFSAAKVNGFDLGLFKAGEKYDEATGKKIERAARADEIRFKEPGKVNVFCNIHPAMSAVVVVVPTQYYAETSEDGAFRLDAAALAGNYLLHGVDEIGNEAQAPVTLPAAAPVELKFNDRKVTVPTHLNKHGKPYVAGSADSDY